MGFVQGKISLSPRKASSKSSSVGIGGHVLHGGQGYGSHTYGLLLDFLVEAELVIANGSVITASDKQNSEVFWALRGAEIGRASCRERV